MKNEALLKETETFVKSVLQGDSSGHDWWHIHRVRKLALMIAKSERADLFLVELAALLHDVDDWKLAGNEEEGEKAKKWLQSCGVDNQIIEWNEGKKGKQNKKKTDEVSPILGFK